MQARHPAADFAFANPEVAGDALIGKVALNQPQQLEFGPHQVASQLVGGEAMHPGRSCHNVSVSHFGFLRLFHLACNTPATSAAVLTQPKKVDTL